MYLKGKLHSLVKILPLRERGPVSPAQPCLLPQDEKDSAPALEAIKDRKQHREKLWKYTVGKDLTIHIIGNSLLGLNIVKINNRSRLHLPPSVLINIQFSIVQYVH